MRTQATPLGAIGRGLTAGVGATALMTTAQELSARLQASSDDHQEDSGDQQEPRGDQQDQDPWEQASVPAKLARRVSEGVFEHELSPQRIPLLTHGMHWAYGTAWGAVYGLIHETFGGRRLRQGVLFGSGVWAMSYAQLVPMGLYEAPWTYPRKDIAMEVGYHLVYGAGLAAAYGLFDRR